MTPSGTHTSHSKMKLQQIFATRLRDLMSDERYDLDTQMKLEAKTGVSQSNLQRILKGKANTTLEVVEKIAKAFRAKPEEMLKAEKDWQTDDHDDEDVRLLRLWSLLAPAEQDAYMSLMQAAAAKSGRQVPIKEYAKPFAGSATELRAMEKQPTPNRKLNQPSQSDHGTVPKKKRTKGTGS